MTTPAAPWTNWTGNVVADPIRRTAPTTVAEVTAAVISAAESGTRVKCVGAGH